MAKTGCQWHMLPNDFPPYRIVYHYWHSLCDRHVISDMLHKFVS
ncbi:MAG: hypothetical protein K2M53_01035 [Muribaculaceae bacterium]|nr:hypothetical protein [Muribaculaceae bacterium]